MKKYLLFVLITVLCVDLVSCAFIQDNNEETEQTGAEVSSENDGTKPLNDFPGERWFMHENFSYNLWSKFPESVVIEIDALEFKNIERGIVLAEIVDIDVELDDVRAFQAPLFFNSRGDNVAFSTAGNDCIHK